ncbi:hypothetical protein Q5P01_008802 [Channa striata]|uniref:Uncharacterized protein n=1 Tax=Channa striata TaxID=64152 RepID=A0AA88N4Q8_CHASR|nr:hypothetical protein Q5P01_008802 [Channa striata]
MFLSLIPFLLWRKNPRFDVITLRTCPLPPGPPRCPDSGLLPSSGISFDLRLHDTGHCLSKILVSSARAGL